MFTAADRPLTGGNALSGPFPTVVVGTYEWVATYNGDANNNTVTSVCGDEPVVITQATPTIATTPSAGGPVGSTGISDTATVSGGFNPTGNVTFNLFAPGDTGCTGTPGPPPTRSNAGSATSSTFPSTRLAPPLDGHLQR